MKRSASEEEAEQQRAKKKREESDEAHQQEVEESLQLFKMATTLGELGGAALYRLSSVIKEDAHCKMVLAKEPNEKSAQELLALAKAKEARRNEEMRLEEARRNEEMRLEEARRNEEMRLEEARRNEEKLIQSVIRRVCDSFGIEADQKLVDTVRELPTKRLEAALSAINLEELSRAGFAPVLAARDTSADVSLAVGQQFTPLASELAVLELPSMDAVIHIRDLIGSPLPQPVPCSLFEGKLPDDISAWLKPSAVVYSSLGNLARLQLELPVIPPHSEMEVTEHLTWIFHRALEILSHFCEPSFAAQANVSPSSTKSPSGKKSGRSTAWRPDFFLDRLGSVLLVGEDKKESILDAIFDLVKKIHFDRQLWFKLGLAASANEMSLVLLADKKRLGVSEDSRINFEEKQVRHEGVRVFHLATHRFYYDEPSQKEHKENRCRVVFLAINAFRLVHTFMDLAFFNFSKNGSHGLVHAKWTEDDHFVYEKELTDCSFSFVDRLCEMYQRVAEARADPSTTSECDFSLVQAKVNRENSKVIVSTPGLRRTPKDENELKGAVRSVLCALSILHRAGIAHYDIRWPNIIRAFDQGKPRWVLIDLEYMQTFGEPHPPKLRVCPPKLADGKVEPVSAAYDIWLVGNLVIDSEGHGLRGLSEDAANFARALMAANPNDRPSLASALQHPWLRAPD